MMRGQKMRSSRAQNVVKANDLAVKKVAKAPHDKQREYKIEGVRGLSVVVKPSGVATYFLRYQIGSGKQRKETRAAIGKVGEGGLSLADARAKADTMMRDVEKGVDVVAVQEEKARAMTLRQLFEARCKADKGTNERTLGDYRAVLERDVFGELGKPGELGERPAGEIAPEEFAKALEGVASRAKHTAHKARSALGSTYRWGMRQWQDGKRLVVLNPVVSIGFTFQSERRKRVLTDDELAKLWKASESAGESVTEPVCDIVQLAILTGQRNSEVAGMELVELKGLDTATPRWTIPGRRMKRKSDDQHVPLSKQAVAIIQQAMARPGGNGVHLFPGVTQGRRVGHDWRQEHIGQETVSRAFAKLAGLAGLKDVHLHDMRKCITSWLAEHNHATPDVLDAILHHGRKGVTGTHYNFALYDVQVRRALQTWADHIWQITGKSQGAKAGNVAEFRRPA